MKKVIMIALMAASVSLSAMAQEQGQRGQRNFDPTEMAQRRTDMMAERYGLDESQKGKLLELNKKYPGMMMGPRMGEPRPGGGGDGQMRRQRPQQGNGDNQQAGPRQMQGQRPGFGPGQGGPGRGPGRFNPEQMKEYEEALKGILTDEQYQKYEADKKERMERMQQRRPQQ